MKEFTVKEIAEILGVSKPTIQRAIKAAAIEADREDKQTRYYSLEKASIISQNVSPNFDFFACVGCSETPQHEPPQTETPQQITETDHQTAENVAEQTETDRHKTETPPQTESLEFMKAMLTTIQEQLAAKDKQIAAYEAQIAAKDKQIEDYSARLAEAMQLTRGQQYIAAADKTAELMAAGSQEEDVIVADAAGVKEQNDTPTQKKSFFKRIFGID